jgi:hypothetical protein
LLFKNTIGMPTFRRIEHYQYCCIVAILTFLILIL